MNAPHSPSPLAAVPMAPADPILGVTEAFIADQNPKKVNLGVGVYYRRQRQDPAARVRAARRERAAEERAAARLPADRRPAGLRPGGAGAGVRPESAIKKRIVTVQALGGTGGLKIGADFLRAHASRRRGLDQRPELGKPPRSCSKAPASRSRPTPTTTPKTRGLDFAGMLESLNAMPPGSIVVLHACCHNPTGVDLSNEQWAAVLEVVRSRGLVPFLDLAYQGFAEGLEADAYAARLFAGAMRRCSSRARSPSRSRSMASASARSASSPAAPRKPRACCRRSSAWCAPTTPTRRRTAASSSPPSWRRAQLRSLWDRELGAMRDRIKEMRKRLVDKIHTRAPGSDFSFVLKQRGMFSYSGLTQGAGAPPARGQVDLHHRHRPHLRRRAHLEERRLRRRCHRRGNSVKSPVLPDPR